MQEGKRRKNKPSLSQVLKRVHAVAKGIKKINKRLKLDALKEWEESLLSCCQTLEEMEGLAQSLVGEVEALRGLGLDLIELGDSIKQKVKKAKDSRQMKLF